MSATKPVNFSFCPRCNGAERLSWTTHDGGICYKCEGLGYQGAQTDEHDQYVSEIRKQWSNQKAYSHMKDLLNYFITEKLWSSSLLQHSKDCMLTDLVYFSNALPESAMLKINPVFMANLPDILIYDLNDLRSYKWLEQDGNVEVMKNQMINNNQKALWNRKVKEYEIVGDNGRIEVINHGSSITVNFLDINKPKST